jgi:DNA-binding NtrC family response regulator
MIEQTQSAAKTKTRILLVDDDPIILDNLAEFLEAEGYEAVSVGTAVEAVGQLRGSSFALVVVDVAMPDRDGFELLRHVRQNYRNTLVILVTRYGTIESAVEAIRQGAYDYLAKPLTRGELRTAIERASQQQRLLAANGPQSAALSGGSSLSGVVGQDYRMSKVLEMIETVADSRSTVLITGQSGTGKSLIARAIHARSPRRDKPFVEVACGAIPDNLLESELFGHVRGAFTDAVADKLGKFAVADGGTIFLDEVSTASPQLQIKLLRVLQEREFEPVGSNQTKHTDVRVILATNRDLWAEVQDGRFRQDLYYRINVVNIELPPLRDRIGDIPLLAEHFLAKFLAGSPKRILGFSPQAASAMQRYAWPGNIRELENCVERAVVLCRHAYIDVGDLPPAVLGGADHHGEKGAPDHRRTLKGALAEPEKQVILAALRAGKGNRQATARQLGINRSTLYKKMKRYGLDWA